MTDATACSSDSKILLAQVAVTCDADHQGKAVGILDAAADALVK